MSSIQVEKIVIPDAPEYVIWELTLRCNLRCKHCAAAAGRGRADELSTDEALMVVEQLKELGVGAVALMGGEVLVRRDWDVVAKALIDKGIYVGIITNGMLFDQEVAKRCEAMGIVQVGVSIDGPRELHDSIRGVKGAFDRALRAIDLVQKMDIPHKTVITSVNKMNYDFLEQTLEILLGHAKGFTWMINMTSVHERGRMSRGLMLDEDEFIGLAKFIGENRKKYKGVLNITGTHDMGYFSDVFGELTEEPFNGCEAGIRTLGIRSNGDVVGCSILPDEFVEGNVRQRTLREIWEDAGCCAYNRHFDITRLEGKCKGCKYAAKCRAGCTDMALSYMGTIYEYPFCLHDLEQKGRI